jgi:hypothetical protein
VETFGAGRGDLEIIVVNPNGVKEPVSSYGLVDFTAAAAAAVVHIADEAKFVKLTRFLWSNLLCICL